MSLQGFLEKRDDHFILQMDSTVRSSQITPLYTQQPSKEDHQQAAFSPTMKNVSLFLYTAMMDAEI